MVGACCSRLLAAVLCLLTPLFVTFDCCASLLRSCVGPLGIYLLVLDTLWYQRTPGSAETLQFSNTDCHVYDLFMAHVLVYQAVWAFQCSPDWHAQCGGIVWPTYMAYSGLLSDTFDGCCFGQSLVVGVAAVAAVC